MKYLFANWKSNKHAAQVDDWFSQFRKELGTEKFEETEIVIFPPFPLLLVAQAHLEKMSSNLGVQDLSPFGAGSYTGAVSVQNLIGYEIKYALLGHSERRRYFHETNQEIAAKVEQAVDAGITPVVCIDEDDLATQAQAISQNLLSKCLVAYEPLEAIGTGNNAPVNKVEEIKNKVKQLFGEVPFLYGGSVNENNVNEYLLVSDGVLVGGASLDAKKFAKLILAARGHQAVRP